jgi:hypothetical protein
MLFRAILPITLVAALLIPVGTASAKYSVGISDQSNTMFYNSHFQALGLKKVRYIVSWDWEKNSHEVGEVNGFLNEVRTRGFQPLITFNAPRGCWSNNRYSRSKRCKAPSVKAFRKAFKSFRAQFPWIDTYAPWNEANHQSQPVDKNPRRAAQYFNAVKKSCKRCTIVAADVLDEGDAPSWLRKFKRYARGEKLYGLHNYSTVNRKTPSRTTALMRVMRGGQVWWTETGGIVRFGSFGYSESRAANRTKYMFQLADRYTKKRRGMARVTRLYPYQWTGAARGARFDAGMTNPDGSPRKSYFTFKKYADKRAK